MIDNWEEITIKITFDGEEFWIICKKPLNLNEIKYLIKPQINYFEDFDLLSHSDILSVYDDIDEAYEKSKNLIEVKRRFLFKNYFGC